MKVNLQAIWTLCSVKMNAFNRKDKEKQSAKQFNSEPVSKIQIEQNGNNYGYGLYWAKTELCHREQHF